MRSWSSHHDRLLNISSVYDEHIGTRLPGENYANQLSFLSKRSSLNGGKTVVMVIYPDVHNIKQIAKN